MIANLKPYSTYKDSGVPWLGAVPKHWEVLPNRAVFAEVKERDHPQADMLSVTITKGVIRQQALLQDSSKKDSSNQDKSAYKLVRPGDIAYNKMRAWQGAVGVSEFEGIVSPAYVVQRPREGTDPRYLHYLLRTPAFAKEAERWSYGITSDMWSLRPEHFKMIYSCFPPLPEQAAIVRYLNHADRRIRRYVHAKQKLIKLLEEQKQAIIQRAVTRGLNPNVRLKPSGVEWLGDVPEHWKVKRLKHLVTQRAGIQMGPFGASLTQLQNHNTGFKLFGQENTISGDFRIGNRWITGEQYQELRRYELVPGDLVLTRKGSIGKCRLVPEDATRGIADSDTIRVRLNQECVSQSFVVMLLHSAPYVQQQIQSVQRGAVLGGLNTSTIADLWIAVPPLEEQCGLLEKIEGETCSIGQSIGAVESELSLLREYRIRLIADVVTGKLDVREAAAKLPDETAVAKPFNETEISMEGEEETEVSTLDDVPEEAKA